MEGNGVWWLCERRIKCGGGGGVDGCGAVSGWIKGCGQGGACTQIRMGPHRCVFKATLAYTRGHKHTRAHIHMHTHTHAYTCTHTQPPNLNSPCTLHRTQPLLLM